MGLALLPPHLIVSEWENIKSQEIEGLNGVEQVGLRALQKFMDTYWMVIVGPSAFSVWGLYDRRVRYFIVSAEVFINFLYCLGQTMALKASIGMVDR